MGHYRKVDTRIWNDENFNKLSDRGKLVFFFILTHPHLTMLGAMRASPSGLASELSWSVEDFRQALTEAVLQHMIKVDEKASFIWLVNFIKYNKPESPNVVKSWEKVLDYLPECILKKELIQYVYSFIKDMPKAFIDALPQVFLKSMLNQEQEQEQEQEKILSRVANAARPKCIVNYDEVDDVSQVNKIFKYWQEVTQHPKAKLDAKRKHKITTALKNYGVEQVKRAIDGCILDAFCMGKNEHGKRFDDIELILRDSSHIEKFITLADTAPEFAMGINGAKVLDNSIFAGAL